MADTKNKDRYLTLRWNNVLTAMLGLVTLTYVAVALVSSTLSNRVAFVGMVLIGAVY
jgi:hypothetical protein